MSFISTRKISRRFVIFVNADSQQQQQQRRRISSIWSKTRNESWSGRSRISSSTCHLQNRFVKSSFLSKEGEISSSVPSPQSSISSLLGRRRNFAAYTGNEGPSSSPLSSSIDDTPLGSGKAASELLDGLEVHEVSASDDGHPLAVYSIPPPTPSTNRPSILLLHGRTWSSVPVFHLLGGPQNARRADLGSRSLMEALNDIGISPYAMDFRGFGGTPQDHTGCIMPDRCVADVESVLKFIASRHQSNHHHNNNNNNNNNNVPALLGWSQGALVAQLVAQRSPHLLSKLILYGSIYDPLVTYPRAPLYTNNTTTTTTTTTTDKQTNNNNINITYNTYDAAIEDFTVEGSIPPTPAKLFAEAALATDPIKAQWTRLHQFNNVDPARVNIPTLVVAGDQDPYAPLRVQSDLFTHLGRGADRSWSIIANADHAVHLLDGGRYRFIQIVKSFMINHDDDGDNDQDEPH